MKRSFFLPMIVVTLWLLGSGPVAQTQDILVVHRNVHLREQATTQSPSQGVLLPGTELEMRAETRTGGFWPVRTDDGRDGWVYFTLVHVEESDAVVVPTFPGEAAILSTWEKPDLLGSCPHPT